MKHSCDQYDAEPPWVEHIEFSADESICTNIALIKLVNIINSRARKSASAPREGCSTIGTGCTAQGHR